MHVRAIAAYGDVASLVTDGLPAAHQAFSLETSSLGRLIDASFPMEVEVEHALAPANPFA